MAFETYLDLDYEINGHIDNPEFTSKLNKYKIQLRSLKHYNLIAEKPNLKTNILSRSHSQMANLIILNSKTRELHQRPVLLAD